MKYYRKVLSKYATFAGRAGRKEFWYFLLANVIIYKLIVFFEGAFSDSDLSRLYTLALFIPTIAVAVRRVHDVGKRGWFILIPIYSWILFMLSGNSFDNKFGPAPTEQ